MNTHYIVEGCTWEGEIVQIDGKPVECGHKHRSAAGAKSCIARTRKIYSGKCETYRVAEVITSAFLTTGLQTVIKKYHEAT